MIEEALASYGVLGLWTGYQIYKETTLHKKLITAIEGLQDAINKRNK